MDEDVGNDEADSSARLVRKVDIQSFLVCQFLNLFPFKLASHACSRLLERSNSLSIPIHCMMATAVAGPSTKPVQPFYCGVCSLPTEYCEFGPSITKCKTWLETEDQGEFSRLWGEGESNQSRWRSLGVQLEK